MEKDKNIIKQEAETIVNRDGDGKIISAAFPVSERTKKIGRASCRERV